jgi:hypothetical protein
MEDRMVENDVTVEDGRMAKDGGMVGWQRMVEW